LSDFVLSGNDPEPQRPAGAGRVYKDKRRRAAGHVRQVIAGDAQWEKVRGRDAHVELITEARR
jgi:hypothetical protein